jgi:hypothetical protein
MSEEYKVKIWLRDGVVCCCSQLCDEECPNITICKDVIIKLGDIKNE